MSTTTPEIHHSWHRRFICQGTQKPLPNLKLQKINITKQYGDDIQERQTLSGMKSTDPAFGKNLEDEYGTLTTYKEFDSSHQKLDSASKKYTGRYPTLDGFNQGYYESLVDTLSRNAPLQVDPQTSRDGIRLMELARESHDTGRTVFWS